MRGSGGGGGSGSNPITRATSGSGGFLPVISAVADLVSAGMGLARRSEPSLPQPVFNTFAPVYLVPQEPQAGAPSRPDPVPRDPSKPLTREEIFHLSQRDTGPGGATGAYYVAQNTFGGTAQGYDAARAGDGAGGRAGSVARGGSIAYGPMGEAGDAEGGGIRYAQGGGIAQDVKALSGDDRICDSFTACVRSGKFGQAVSQAYGRLFTPAGGSPGASVGPAPASGDVAAELEDAAADKRSCLADPDYCFRRYTGSRLARISAGTVELSGFDETVPRELADEIPPEDAAALGSYPPDAVVEVCYGANCRYSYTDVRGKLDVDPTPAAFGAGPTDYLKLTPVGVFSSGEMARQVAQALNGGAQLAVAIQQAAAATLGRPLYVVPKGVAFMVPLGDIQLQAFLAFTPPPPWAPGTSILNIRPALAS